MGLYQFSHAERVGYPDSYEEDIYALHELLPPKPISKRDFAPELREISPTFVEIYNQAYATGQLGLEQICGVGYRKALEFLVKDFACLENPGATEHIKNMFLGNCIRDYISDARIQGCAKRAVWLGNDETHYVRRWTGKDISDLKILIDLVIFWISSVLLTRKYTAEMPG